MSRAALAILLIEIAGIVSLSAQGWSRSDPYKKLFQPQDLRAAARAQQDKSPQPARPNVVCGMTVIPTDPSIDPKMIERPKDDNTRYTIRAVPPPACK